MCNNLQLDEIESIEYIGEEQTIDITVDGNSLFFANDILTHNSGIYHSDVDMTDTSESISLAQLADFYVAVVSTDELEALNQYLCKQLKLS